MSSIQRPRAWLLMVAFAAVLICFGASSIYAQHEAALIRQKAVDIAGNATPSIERLTAACTELYRLRSLVGKYVWPPAAEAELSEVAASRSRLADEINRYLRFPVFPSEREEWASVQANLRTLDRVTEDILAQVTRGELVGASSALAEQMDPAVERASASVLRGLEFNAAQARRLGLDIDRIRHRAAGIEFALNSVGVALVIVVAILMWRATAAYMNVMETNSRLLAERAEELEQFADRVAHDILSPLGAAQMAFELARRKIGPDAELTATLARGSSCVGRVKRIVEGLFEFARSGARPDVNARAEVGLVLGDVGGEINARAADAGIKFVMEPVAPCAVACSPGVLTSLLVNLLDNAIKYIGDGPRKRIAVRVLDSGERLRFEVEDSGPGLPPALEKTVFDLHVRAEGSKKPGLGLGLATVKRLAVAHGGVVGVRSTPERGSVFWFELPRASEGCSTAARVRRRLS